DRREAVVRRTHDAGENGAVAHAGVEEPQRGRPRLDAVELELDALRDHPFLGAGADEEQVLLPVVVEAKARLRVAFADHAWRDRQAAGRERTLARRAAESPVHERADAIDGLGRHAAAHPEARHELAVIHRAPAEGALRHAGVPAKGHDLGQEIVVAAAAKLRFALHRRALHGGTPRSRPPVGAIRAACAAHYKRGLIYGIRPTRRGRTGLA